MRDYWLSKLFFDMQTPANAAEYATDRDKVLSRYPIKPDVLKSLKEDDVAALLSKRRSLPGAGIERHQRLWFGHAKPAVQPRLSERPD